MSYKKLILSIGISLSFCSGAFGEMYKGPSKEIIPNLDEKFDNQKRVVEKTLSGDRSYRLEQMISLYEKSKFKIIEFVTPPSMQHKRLDGEMLRELNQLAGASWVLARSGVSSLQNINNLYENCIKELSDVIYTCEMFTSEDAVASSSTSLKSDIAHSCKRFAIVARKQYLELNPDLHTQALLLTEMDSTDQEFGEFAYGVNEAEVISERLTNRLNNECRGLSGTVTIDKSGRLTAQYKKLVKVGGPSGLYLDLERKKSSKDDQTNRID